MKRIRLLSLPDPRFSVGDSQYESNRVDYRAIIEQAIRIPLNREVGATIDEMRRGIRVLDALESAHADVLALEDADWEFLRTKVEKMPWAGTDRRFVRFYDDIIGATDAVRDAAPADGVVASS